MTGERITKTYSWTVSSGAEKVNIVMLIVAVRVRCLSGDTQWQLRLCLIYIHGGDPHGARCLFGREDG